MSSPSCTAAARRGGWPNSLASAASTPTAPMSSRPSRAISKESLHDPARSRPLAPAADSRRRADRHELRRRPGLGGGLIDALGSPAAEDPGFDRRAGGQDH